MLEKHIGVVNFILYISIDLQIWRNLLFFIYKSRYIFKIS